MDADELLTTTRSVRKRLDESKPVPRTVLEECAVIGAQAPAGGNNHRLSWLFVDDPAIRLQVVEVFRDVALEQFRGLRERAVERGSQRAYDGAIELVQRLERIPVLAIPCMVGRRPEQMANHLAASWYGSAIQGIWSFQLALRARGLGSVYTTVHLQREREVAEVLGIPEDVTQIALLPVAYTLGTDFKPAARRPAEEFVGYNSWPAR